MSEPIYGVPLSSSIQSVRLPAIRQGAATLLAWVLLWAVLGSGCASQGPAVMLPADKPVLATDEARAVLLLLADRRQYEPAAIVGALQGGEEMRRFTALALGWIGDPRGTATLESLLTDSSLQVRQTAVFALGELGEVGHRQGVQSLLSMLTAEDRETASLAVEALAKSGAPLAAVVERLIQAPTAEFLPRLLLALYRFDDDAVVRWAEQGLELNDARLRAMAAYALARNPRPAGAEALRGLLTEPDSSSGDSLIDGSSIRDPWFHDPWIQGWAARALGRIGEREDLARLRPLLDAARPGPIIQALNAGRALVDAGKASPPEDWRGRLLELFEDPRPGVRLTAIEASSAWLRDEDLARSLSRLAQSGSSRERQLALLSLAAGDPALAEVYLTPMATSLDSVDRAVAAQAAGLVGVAELLEKLAVDSAPGVRRAVLQTWLDADLEASSHASKALLDNDFSVRAAALDWFSENPQLSLEELSATFQLALRDRQPDARLAAIRAMAARAEAEPLERGGLVQLLEEIASEADYLARRQARDALIQLERQPNDLGSVQTGRRIETYRQIAQQIDGKQRLLMETERGTVELELLCHDAPLTCMSFQQLAQQGFYDDTRFHRVVPDFVVQGGDPRGDGAGGPGYTLRDEVNTQRYERGMVGMAHAGPDTAGSQFFITLAPQPHLDGAYTIFGRVIDGEAVLDQLVQGDRILRIVESGSVGSRN